MDVGINKTRQSQSTMAGHTVNVGLEGRGLAAQPVQGLEGEGERERGREEERERGSEGERGLEN